MTIRGLLDVAYTILVEGRVTSGFTLGDAIRDVDEALVPPDPTPAPDSPEGRERERQENRAAMQQLVSMMAGARTPGSEATA